MKENHIDSSSTDQTWEKKKEVIHDRRRSRSDMFTHAHFGPGKGGKCRLQRHLLRHTLHTYRSHVVSHTHTVFVQS